jgi:hypothetical protein
VDRVILSAGSTNRRGQRDASLRPLDHVPSYPDALILMTPSKRHRLREEADAHYCELQASASLSRNLGTLWYRSRGSYRRRRETRSLPTCRESTYSPASRDVAMTRTRPHAGVAQCCSLAAFIAFIKGALKERWSLLVSLVGRLGPLCTAHFADRVSSASRDRERQLRITAPSLDVTVARHGLPVGARYA